HRRAAGVRAHAAHQSGARNLRAAARPHAVRGDRRARRAAGRRRAARDGRLPQPPPHPRIVGALSARTAVSTLLSVRGLVKSFGDLQALRGVSFDAHSGEIVAVIGPNGAGKTTLLSIIAGAQRQSAGTVRCDAAAASNDVGWAPQQPAVYSKLSVSENLRLFAHLRRVADPERAVARMLEQSGLAKRAGERLERLSGGNRQRVNVAIGLIADPPVLVLDEPSASLDPGQRERLWEFVAGLAKAGRGVIFSTHNVDE